MAKNYCAGHGLELIDRFTDRGVSAFKGANQTGELGKLLSVIKSGDTLLVEDADRLSRQDWLTAVNFIGDIVDRGITVVTLANGNAITKESFARNPGIFLPAILRAFLGNDENVKKSFRVKESWAARKRKIIEERKPIRQKLPAWLRWEQKLDRPVLDPEKASTVRRIFKLALEGHGVLSITRQLTESGTPLIGRNRSKGWYCAYVWCILKNKATIGFCCHVDPAVPNIYPSVVDEKTFYSVQAKMKERRGLTTPRQYANNNMFTTLGRCSKCGGMLTRHDQRSGRKVYHYLVCGNAKQGASKCGMSSVGYELLECSVLEILSQFDELRNQMTLKPPEPSLLDELRGKLMSVEKQAKKIMGMIDDYDDPPRRLVDHLRSLQSEEDRLREQVELEKARTLATTPLAMSWAEFRGLVPAKIDEPDFRSKLKNAIRAVLERVVVELGTKTYEIFLHGYGSPIRAELLGGSVFYTFKNKEGTQTLGCCAPLCLRWPQPGPAAKER